MGENEIQVVAEGEGKDLGHPMGHQQVQASPLMQLLSQAVQQGQSIDVIRELKSMAQELAADEARRAFENALADAKGEIPPIVKNRLVEYDNKGGGTTSYRHEDFAEIA